MASAYTFVQKTAPTEPDQLSNFNNLVVDGSHVGMTGALGSGFQTTDATGTPVVSPVTVSNAGVTTIIVPASAIQVTVIAITNTVNVSEADATVATKYFTVPTGVPITFEVARLSKFYMKANGGASTLSFFFNVV